MAGEFEMELRQLGSTDIYISAVALGTWPMAGMTSLNVNESDSVATIAASLDAGINFFDTAYCYGAHGESEKLLAVALRERRDQAVIATKGGIHWMRTENRCRTRGQPLCGESAKRACSG